MCTPNASYLASLTLLFPTSIIHRMAAHFFGSLVDLWVGPWLVVLQFTKDPQSTYLPCHHLHIWLSRLYRALQQCVGTDITPPSQQCNLFLQKFLQTCIFIWLQCKDSTWALDQQQGWGFGSFSSMWRPNGGHSLDSQSRWVSLSSLLNGHWTYELVIAFFLLLASKLSHNFTIQL